MCLKVIVFSQVYRNKQNVNVQLRMLRLTSYNLLQPLTSTCMHVAYAGLKSRIREHPEALVASGLSPEDGSTVVGTVYTSFSGSSFTTDLKLMR